MQSAKMPIWKELADLVQKQGLGDDLGSGLVVRRSSATWYDVVPRTRLQVNLSLVDAGINMKASRTNSEDMPLLHATLLEALKPLGDQIVFSSLRLWSSSNYSSCVIKPALTVKQAGMRIQVTVEALKIVINALKDFNQHQDKTSRACSIGGDSARAPTGSYGRH